MFRVDKGEYRVSRTADGFLQGKAVVSRAGVFTYVNSDGSVHRELRHPSDVLVRDSLETLKLKPVTVDHPPEPVTPDNVKTYQVGSVGETVSVDGYNITASFVVSDKTAIDTIEAGEKRELSLGYMVDLVEEKGVFEGEAYDYRQTNVRYNHLAIVAQGRAGVARINMDGVAVQLTGGDEMAEKAMKTVRLDGIDYEAAPEVVNRLDALEKQVKEGAEALKASEAKAEKAQGLADALKARNDELLEKLAPEAIDALVGERVALVSNVRKLVAEDVKLDGLSVREMQVKAIQAVQADFDDKGRTDEYVAARFDAAVEFASKEPVKKQAESLNQDGVEVPAKYVDQASYFNARREQKQKGGNA